VRGEKAFPAQDSLNYRGSAASENMAIRNNGEPRATRETEKKALLKKGAPRGEESRRAAREGPVYLRRKGEKSSRTKKTNEWVKTGAEPLHAREFREGVTPRSRKGGEPASEIRKKRLDRQRAAEKKLLRITSLRIAAERERESRELH